MKNKIELEIKNRKKGIFLVNTLGIIFDPLKRKILIGKRKNDKYVQELSWSFPGGVLDYGEDIEKAVERTVFEKTGLNVKSLGNIFARVPPENDKFLLLYYLCEVISGKEKKGKDFIELKWISPTDIGDFITTSIDPRLKEYLNNLK